MGYDRRDMPDDHYATVANQYAAHRPTYPPALFAWLAGECAAHNLAWDCGTGNGQAALGLVPHFARVVATDASEAQIARAVAHPRVQYRVAPAEASGLDDGSVDLVVVAQALHWFDQARFAAEVTRVVGPGGLVAAWSYGIARVDDPDVDVLVRRFYQQVSSWWPPGREHVENGYRDLTVPFRPVRPPALEMSVNWTMPQLIGYLRSWSATARAREATGVDLVTALEPNLRRVRAGPADRHTVRWPLAVLVGRREAG